MPEEDKLKKIDISFPVLENIEFTFKKNNVIVKPYLDINDKVALISEYLDNLYGDLSSDLATKYLVAEYALIAQIIDRNTNIEIEKLLIDEVISNGLWFEIKSKIKNYEEFRFELMTVLELHRNQLKLEKSIGTMLENISNKLMEVLNQFSTMDVESLKKVADQFAESKRI